MQLLTAIFFCVKFNYGVIKMKTESIKDIRKKFKNRKEWLLIKVDKFDKVNSRAINGHLIAHAKDRDEIYRKAISCKGFTLIDYSEDLPPRGYAFAF